MVMSRSILGIADAVTASCNATRRYSARRGVATNPAVIGVVRCTGLGGIEGRDLGRPREPEEEALDPLPELGLALPGGIWSVSGNVTVVNRTGQPDVLRRGLANSAGNSVAGTATNWTGFQNVGVPVLITLASPDRINLEWSHDNTLPASRLVAITGVVVAQKVAPRF
jgi:hypothetical protein